MRTRKNKNKNRRKSNIQNSNIQNSNARKSNTQKSNRHIRKMQMQMLFGGAPTPLTTANKPPTLRNSELNINYITNETRTSELPSFSALRLTNLSSTIIAAAKEKPFLCENYKYSDEYLSSKLKSYKDVLMFLYNENRYNKYMTEMITKHGVTEETSTDKQKQSDLIRHNIHVTLRLLFSNYLTPSPPFSLKEFKIEFTPSPSNTALRQVVWLSEIYNNPAFSNIIKKSKTYRDNMDSNEKTLVQNAETQHTNVKTYLKPYTDSIPTKYPLLDKNNFSGSSGYTRGQDTHDAINAIYTGNIQPKLNAIKTSSSELEEKYRAAKDGLTNFKTRVSANYTDAEMVEWINKTLEVISNAYTAITNSKSVKLTDSSFSNYVSLRKNAAKKEALKNTFPAYYELMEEMYSLSQTYALDAPFIQSILLTDMTDESNQQILKYNSQSGKSGYIVNIAIEFKTNQNCLDLDLQLGAAVSRRQNLTIMKYTPRYFISDV